MRKDIKCIAERVLQEECYNLASDYNFMLSWSWLNKRRQLFILICDMSYGWEMEYTFTYEELNLTKLNPRKLIQGRIAKMTNELERGLKCQ